VTAHGGWYSRQITHTSIGDDESIRKKLI